jgi:hypothetical protein
MGKAFDTFKQYAAGQYAGQLADTGHRDIVSRLIADTAGAAFGTALTDVDGYSAEIPASGDVPNFILVRESVSVNNADDSISNVAQGHEGSLIREGRVWVQVAGATAKGQVYVVPDTGAISASAGGNLTFTNAKFVTDTNADGFALVQLNGN